MSAGKGRAYLKRYAIFVQYARTVSENPGAVSEIVLAFLYKVNKKGGELGWREELYRLPA